VSDPLAVEAITRVLVRYATSIDTRDWDLFRSCFTADAVTDYEDIGHWTDLDGIASFMERSHAGFDSTNHSLSNFVIDVEGDTATARCWVHVVLVHRDDPGAWIDAVGRYDDTLERTPHGWRIATRAFHLTRSS
jgi:3-phenylpropionate/cinnamic acid dioxygenase small subunit